MTDKVDVEIYVDGEDSFVINNVPLSHSLAEFVDTISLKRGVRLHVSSGNEHCKTVGEAIETLGHAPERPSRLNLSLSPQTDGEKKSSSRGRKSRIIRRANKPKPASKKPGRIKFTPAKGATPPSPPSRKGPSDITLPERSVGATGKIYQKAGTCTSGGQIPISVLIRSNNEPTLLETDSHSGGGEVEIIFLIDTSGSMSAQIDGVKQSCLDFAQHILNEGLGLNLGLIGFDIGGHRGTNGNYTVMTLSQYTIGIWPLTDPKSFQRDIQSLSLGLFGGGGCYIAAEDTVDIFPNVVQAYSNSKNREKILVIISDEMGGSEGVHDIIGHLKQGNITTYVLGCTKGGLGHWNDSNVALGDANLGAHEFIALQTGGEFWNIHESQGQHDFSILLSEVAKTIARGIRSSVPTVSRKKSEPAGTTAYDAEIVRVTQVPKGSVTMGSNSDIPDGHGFNSLNITTFKCICGQTQVDICPFCGHMMCASEALSINNPDVTCMDCGERFLVDESDRTSAGGLYVGGGKK